MFVIHINLSNCYFALITLDAEHLVHCFLEHFLRVSQQRVVTKMDTVIGHVSDHDITLGDRMKCQRKKRLRRNSDRHTGIKAIPV